MWGSLIFKSLVGPCQPPGLCCLLLSRLYIQWKTRHKAYGNPQRGRSFITWDHCSPVPARSPWGHRCLKNSMKFIPIESEWQVMWKATGGSSARACRSHVRCHPKGHLLFLFSYITDSLCSQALWTLLMEAFGEELLWRAAYFLSPVSCLAGQEGNLVTKKHHVFNLQAVSFKPGEWVTIYSALKRWQISEEDLLWM